ncbi:MAG TPA: Asp23/Gls24 family envelope stress response protein [Anaerolineales bacterium]|nr:Asp23/Gls24 family envelope stress response protein [Anaerolineales bacterium]
MTTEPRSPGKTTIDPGVLHTIARLTALRVDGVSRLSPVPGGVNRLTRRGQEGIRIEVEDSRVDVDVYVILLAGTNVRDVSRTIQNNVARAVSEMVGMEIGRIGVHIEDIDYQEA